MFQRVTLRTTGTSALRTRAAVLAAGLGASVVLGTGVATAAGAPETAGTQAVAAAAQGASKAGWVDPVQHYKLSASFAQNGGMWAHKHSGQDFAVPSGTKVFAAHAGTVVKAGGWGAGDGPAYGNAIVIKHGNGTYSQYAHLSKIQVKIGEKVNTGEQIALSGNTGNSSGPHLHFEIRTTPNYGSAVNPVAFLASKGVKV
jgi:murein DD-endopeptidase MepM/ murein hydrolase activator NlpD